MKKALVVLAWALVWQGADGAADASDAWPAFSLPWDAPSGGFPDARFLLDAPAGKHGPVDVDGGHLKFQGGGRVRFYGVNLSGEACFPPPALAPMITDRIARSGFNIVRFHGMDAGWGRSIFDPKSGGTRRLDPEALDRLDAIAAELEARGIYLDLNLHVGRRFTEADGAAEAAWLSYAKFATIFDQRLIELQKEYARQLLGHRNPRTGKTYAEDAAVAIVELTNENSLIGGWRSGFLRGGQRSRPPDGWTDIPPAYGRVLDDLWNTWLLKRHGPGREGEKPGEPLDRAWAAGARPAGPEEISNGVFERGSEGWSFWAGEGARAKLAVAREGGRPAARVDVEKVDGTRWHVMLTARGLAVRKGVAYQASFRVRADPARAVTVEVAHDGPYRGHGATTVEAGPEAAPRSFSFVAAEDDAAVRLSLQLGERTGTVWIESVSFREAAIDGLREGEDPSKGTVRRLSPDEFGTVTAARFREEARFYEDIEEAYYGEMRRLLKKDLGVLALVEGTNENYGLPALRAQATLDLMDCHAYWQHPSFPHGWSNDDFRIPNSPMVDEPEGGTIGRLCRSAVLGKPFAVTEYNHPFPSEYGCEAPLLLAALASLQDWDALFLYTLCHGWDEKTLGGNEITGFFDVGSEPSKMAQVPAAAALFIRGDVRPARQTVTVEYSPDRVLESCREGPVWGGGFHLDGDLSPLIPFVHGFRIARFDAERTTRVADLGLVPPAEPIQSDTGELRWQGGKGSGVFTIGAPCIAAAVGWTGGRRIDAGVAAFEIARPAFSATSATSLDGKPLAQSERILLVSAARSANTGEAWNAERTCLASWGRAPVRIEPVEGKVVVLRRAAPEAGVPPIFHLSPLDGRGRPIGEPQRIEVQGGALVAVLRTAPPTLWYSLQAVKQP